MFKGRGNRANRRYKGREYRANGRSQPVKRGRATLGSKRKPSWCLLLLLEMLNVYRDVSQSKHYYIYAWILRSYLVSNIASLHRLLIYIIYLYIWIMFSFGVSRSCIWIGAKCHSYLGTQLITQQKTHFHSMVQDLITLFPLTVYV